MSMFNTLSRDRSKILSGRERGAAAVEFALLLPVLVILLLGIIDFGLYYYNNLQLTHAARDAARYLSVNNQAGAAAAIADTNLVSTVINSEGLNPAVSGQPASVTLTATYSFVTPLPLVAGLGRTAQIDASVVMRRE